MLHSIANNGNIFQVQYEAQRSESGLAAALEALRTGRFRSEGEWVARISADGTPTYARPMSELCLLEGLILHEIDPMTAREYYVELKASRLWNSEQNHWRFGLHEWGQGLENCAMTSDQLLGLLLESRSDPESAKCAYSAMKKHSCRVGNEWLGAYSPGEHKSMHDEALGRLASALLLDCLLTHALHSDAGFAAYQQAKNGPLWDDAEGVWRGRPESNGEVACWTSFTRDQLLAVLLEAKADRRAAADRYESLRSGPGFDAQRGEWRLLMRGMSGLQAEHAARDQLLGLLVEHTLFGSNVRPGDELPALPKVREF